MIAFKIEEFVSGEIFKEEEFRDKIEAHDWSQYDNQVVLLHGCSKIFIPQWAYIIVAVRLSHWVRKLSFGEPRTQIPIYRKAPERAEEVVLTEEIR